LIFSFLNRGQLQFAALNYQIVFQFFFSSDIY